MAQSNFPALTVQQVQTAYLAFFNRPADSAGLAYWTSDQHKGGLPGMWSSFGLVPEFSTTFGNKPATEIVETFYMNMFGRPSDAAGKAYWLAELSAGRVDIGNLAAAFDAGAAPADKTILSGKVVANTATTQAAIDAGTTFLLTTGADDLTGTALNDTFTAALGTFSASDEIDGGEGNDTLNATLNRAFEMDVRNVENININWTGFAAPTFDLDSVDGATVSISSTQTGYLGNANFDNVAENSISAGAGITGTLTVDGIEDASVTATVARVIDIGTADGAITVNAGAAETVDVDGAEEVTVVALEADDIDLRGGFDVATVTLGVDADAVLIGADDAVVNLNSAEDITVTIDGTSVFEVLNLGGAGEIDLDIEMAFTAFTEDFQINGGGVVTLSGAIGDGELTGIEHSEILLATVNAGAATLTLGADANIVLEVGLAGAVTFEMNEDLDTAADSMTLTLETETGGHNLVFTTADQEIESVTVNITPNDDFDTDDNFIIHNLTGSNADDGPATEFVIVSADDDVNVKVEEVIAATVDATGVAGEFEGISDADDDEDMTVFAAAGDTTFTFTGITAGSTFISGNDADDTVTFVTTEGTAVAQFADGDNTVLADGVTTADGTVAVIAGDGDDTVTFAAAQAGVLFLQLGGGDNIVIFDDLDDGAQVSLIAGAGDDRVTFEGVDAGSSGSINLGAGTNRIELGVDADITATTISISGLDEIEIAEANAAVFTAGAPGSMDGPVVRSSLLNGTSIKILSSGAGGDPDALLGVMLQDGTTSFDGSSLEISDSITTGVLGLNIGFVTQADDFTIIGSEGSDTITTGTGDDTINGGAGADTIDTGDGDNTVTGGAGADSITLGTDRDTVVQGRTDSVVATGSTFFGDVFADEDEIEFENGVDTITGFIDGDDGSILDLFKATQAVTAIGVDTDDLVAGTNYFLSGVFDADVFTVAEDGAGADTLIIQGYAGAGTDITTNQSIVLLIGVGSDDLVAANFA